jgi:GAF domain-containing protein/anti-sigma regulatory factor (Ser/Thr protein kinase)
VRHTLRLTEEPDAVPTARRYVRDRLKGTPLEHRSDDAELIVTELVTNASLHGRPPIVLDVDVDEDRVRMEVGDSSAGAPVRPLRGPEVMTGRGLLLVESFSDRWGLDRRDEGKTVWAEVGLSPAQLPDSEGDLAGVPVGPGDEFDMEVEEPPDEEARYPIELGEVPTDLLVAAKTHIDNVIREFVLVSSGAASGQSAAVSQHLAGLIDTVTTRFAEARQSIKRQAMASVMAGRKRTHLVLELPLSAIKAGSDYLAALDEVDAYARAARLLTLETPPQHRAFRRWYVSALIEQLSAAEMGEKPRSAIPFEQFLLDEYGIVARAHRATDRSARLQHVSAALARATTVDEVASVVVSQGVEALGASGGALLLPAEGEDLTVLAEIHYGEKLVAHLRAGGGGKGMPSVTALRTGEPVWVESVERRDEQFPELRNVEPDTVSMCAVPLTLGGRVLAVLRLSFNSPRLFDDEERAFVLAFVALTVQALDRAELYNAERRARAEAETSAGRLTRLNHVTAALAGVSEVHEIGEIVAVEAQRTLGAAISALCLLEDDGQLEVVEIRGVAQGTRDRWGRFPLSADVPASEAVRTNKPVVVKTSEELERRYPALTGETTVEQGLVCMPLSLGGRAVGVLSLSFLPPYVVDDDTVELLSTIGHQCALAVERAHLIEAERTARRRASFLADSTARVTSSLEPEETLAHLTDLVVPELADWCAVYLTDEAGQVVAGTAQHRDAELTAQMRDLQRVVTFDHDSAGDFGDVLRTGRRICDPVTSEQRREQVSRLFGRSAVARSLRPNSVVAVPFVRRERVLGGLLLARVDGPAYTDDELLLASEVADRAAVALDNAARFGRERAVALTLQRSLLPQVLPNVPGLSFAWRYFPGAAGTHVGGDWYDVIPLERGRVALVIGDVMGRGVQAAAVMGQLRATARAHISGDFDPGDVLARMGSELMRLEQEQIATVLLCLFDPQTGRLTAASAGHLPPLVRTDDGGVDFLDVRPGPPLGAGSVSYANLEVTLHAGATVLLYTDGLVEDRRLPIDKGMATLSAAAVGSPEPELLCDRALVALGRDTEHDDDTAMLAVHFEPV